MAAQQPKRTEPEPKAYDPFPRTTAPARDPSPPIETTTTKKPEPEKKAPSKPLFKGSSTNPFAKRPGSGGVGAGA